jgi:chemotaxis family two-component system sensor kinase Cph1
MNKTEIKVEEGPSDVKGAQKGNDDFIAFAYTAAHDLKSPLHNITGFIRILEDHLHLKGHIEPDIVHDLFQITTAAKRMVALIDNLLMYAKAGSGELSIDEVNMENALQTALQNLHKVIEKSHAVIVHDPLPTILCDGTHVICLLQNLIENAIKFRGDKVPHIEVRSEMRGDEVVFFVRDNGIGIDPQYHAKIFNVFERLHSQSDYPGTGIGLAVCKKIVERHKGRIWVTSQLGEGTTFAFTLQKGE